MGVIYSVFPFDDRIRQALRTYDMSDEGWPQGRNPSVAEVRQAVDGLSGFRATYQPVPTGGGSWGVVIDAAENPEEGQWTHLRVLKYVDERTPTPIYFEKGCLELVLATVARLAESCGTLCVVPDTGEAPLIVPSGTDAAALHRAWQQRLKASDAGGEDGE